MKQHESFIEVAKAAPVASVGGLTMFGYHMNDIVLVMTFIYTAFLIIDKLPTVLGRFRQLWNYLRGKP